MSRHRDLAPRLTCHLKAFEALWPKKLVPNWNRPLDAVDASAKSLLRACWEVGEKRSLTARILPLPMTTTGDAPLQARFGIRATLAPGLTDDDMMAVGNDLRDATIISYGGQSEKTIGFTWLAEDQLAPETVASVAAGHVRDVAE